MTGDAFETVSRIGVIPVIAIPSADYAEPLADALLEGGLPIAEITFRTEAAAEAMAHVSKSRPELLMGAGTILSPAAVDRAVQAGAAFGLAPGHDPAVLDAARAADLPFAPGVMTPSDISLATARGCRLMKFFPAMSAGGPTMLKNIAAPFMHLGLGFIPTGGVTEENMSDWLSMSMISAVGGTWIARAEDMEAGDWSKITDRARRAVERAGDIRG